MKKFLGNQKGSIPLVLVLIMLGMGTVATLSSFVSADRTGQYKSKHYIQEVLNEESLYEVFYFEIASHLDNKYYGLDTYPILSTAELTEIQNNINQHLQTNLAEYLGEKKTLDKFTFREEGFTAFDLCSNPETCTFDLTFEITLSPPKKGMILTLTDLQWNNVSTSETPIYQLSTLHSKWRFQSQM